MNNTIEVLEFIRKKYLVGDEWYKALTKAITTLKVLESAEGLPEKREYPSGCSYEEEYEEGYDCSNKCDGCIHGFEKGKVQGFNQAIDLCQKVLAKQILKVKELEECIRDIVNKDFSENEYLAKVEQYTVLEVKYNELIMAVGNKYKDEIRKKINQPQDKERA